MEYFNTLEYSLNTWNSICRICLKWALSDPCLFLVENVVWCYLFSALS